jgi:predicted transcriptional regulator
MELTVNIIKKQRKATKAAKDKLKQYSKMRKAIEKSLAAGPKTIPQLAQELKQPADKVLFYLMTMYKFGLIEVDSIDDMDEYYLYKLKNKTGKESSKP